MQKPGLRIIHSPAAMVVVALLLRVLYIAISGCYRLDLERWYSFEMADVGRCLAQGYGYALGVDSGPSAWVTPLYPFVVALTFRLFGLLSHASAFALLAFNSVFAALTCWIVYRIGQRVFNTNVAVWSGWIWAFLPSSFYFSVFWIWETTLSGFLLGLLFLLTLRMEHDNRLLPWCGYGFLWGLTALTNPAVLLWLPFSGSWLAYRLRQRGQHYLLPVVISSAIFWAILTPWIVRNDRVMGSPIIRSNFGSELRRGNNPQAQGWWVSDYSYNNPALLRQYKTLGEVAFVREQGRQAREWIAAHPQRFMVLTLKRVVFFWAGIPHKGREQLDNLYLLGSSVLSIGGLVLAIRRRVPGVFLFATLLVFYPCIYYVTFPQPRYRHPIEPEMLILAVFLTEAALQRLGVWRALGHGKTRFTFRSLA